jgi:hypothetical protein
MAPQLVGPVVEQCLSFDVRSLGEVLVCPLLPKAAVLLLRSESIQVGEDPIRLSNFTILCESLVRSSALGFRGG